MSNTPDSKDYFWNDERVLRFAELYAKELAQNIAKFKNEDYSAKFTMPAEFKASHTVEEERDWEIVKILHKTMPEKVVTVKDEISNIVNSNFGHNWYIYAVRRKSDGKVFAIGDTFTYDGLRASNWADGTFPIIDSFNIYAGDIYINKHYKGPQRSISQWIKLPKEAVKEVLFTTEDGFPAYKGGWYFYVQEENDFMVVSHSGITEKRPHKYFSTESAAKEWVLMNKPLFSIKDVQSMYADDRQFVGTGWLVEKMIEFAKSKL